MAETSSEFLEKVFARTAPEPNSGCWIWLGSVNQKGYPRINRKGKNRIGTRLIWEALHGEIPDGMLVRHICDTPSCINPDHLTLGDIKANVWDMVRKGRTTSKLSEDDVREMRRRRSKGEKYSSIARDFGVHRCAARNIVAGEKWRHVI